MPRPIDSYQAPLFRLDVDAGVLVPERELGQMGARVVAARYEGRLFVSDRLKRFRNVVHALDAGGVTLRPNQHKVVVHHRKSLHAMSFGDEPQFCKFGMHEHHISIAAPGSVERLTGALRQHLHGDAGHLRENRQQMPVQTRILGRRR